MGLSSERKSCLYFGFFVSILGFSFFLEDLICVEEEIDRRVFGYFYFEKFCKQFSEFKYDWKKCLTVLFGLKFCFRNVWISFYINIFDIFGLILLTKFRSTSHKFYTNLWRVISGKSYYVTIVFAWLLRTFETSLYFNNMVRGFEKIRFYKWLFGNIFLYFMTS